ncbi:MAG: 6-phosphogluconolactonase [Thermoleophilia bacterium]|nr:6-phosphogluconolactonase [Thermoleophilia bacterium]
MEVARGVVGDAEAAAAEVARVLVVAARAGGEVALTGGSSPRRAYELAAAAPWDRAGVWWGDERCVPPGDERSNYRLARESLLDRLARLPRAVHRVRGELDPDRAAALYDEEIRGVRLDLVLLGVGADGHVASLFPRAPELRERERAAVSAEPGLEPLVARVTLTLPKLCEAPLVVFLVTGDGKAEAVERAFAGPPDEAVPASLVRSAGGRTVAVLDRGAASRLPPAGRR